MILRKKLIGNILSLATLSILVANPSFADLGESTQDSSYVFTTSVPQNAVLLHIQIQFNGTGGGMEQVFVPVSGGRVSKRLYLSHGAGPYSISAWYSQNPSPYQSAGEQVYSGRVDVTNTDTRDLRYLLPSGDVQSDDPEIISTAREITANAQSDTDKALAIHDWIASHIAYDSEAYFSGSYATKVYDAASALRTRVSICNGYSNLYAALARASGLRTKIIIGAIIWPSLGQTWEQIGTSQPHAWNEVFADGRWITVDSTWDSGDMDFTTHTFTQRPTHKYYNISPGVFARDHRKVSVSPN